jgi:hypothetical protein
MSSRIPSTRHGSATRRVSRWRLVPRAPSSCRVRRPPLRYDGRVDLIHAAPPARIGPMGHSALGTPVTWVETRRGSFGWQRVSPTSHALDGRRAFQRAAPNACRPFVLRGTSRHDGRGATGGMPLPPARASEEPRRHGRVVRIGPERGKDCTPLWGTSGATHWQR